MAVNLSQTVREVMPTLEAKDAEAPVINALRKEVDRRQIEFVKSGKLLPVPFSSRHYDFKRQQWVFGKATDDAMAEFIERKVYWETTLGGSARVWLGDPAEAQYLQTTTAHLVEIARARLRRRGCCELKASGRKRRQDCWDMRSNLRDAARRGGRVEKKHAFERG